MNRPLYSWVIGTGLCLAVWAQCETLIAQLSRPIDEMRGDCSQDALNVQNELATMENLSQKLTALTNRVTAPPMSPLGQSLLITLHNTNQVTLAATPKHSGPSAGLLAFSVPIDRYYRVSIGSAVWIEVVEGRTRLEPTEFEMQTGCATLFKTIQYRLKKDVGYWLELSGNFPAVTLLLSSETR